MSHERKPNQKKKHSIICSGILRIHQHKCQITKHSYDPDSYVPSVDAFWKHWIWPRGAYESTDKKHLWPEPLPPRPRPLTTNIWIPFALTRGLSLPISRTSTHAWKSGGPGHPTREVMKCWEAELQQEELPLHQGITANELRINAFWCDGATSFGHHSSRGDHSCGMTTWSSPKKPMLPSGKLRKLSSQWLT